MSQRLSKIESAESGGATADLPKPRARSADQKRAGRRIQPYAWLGAGAVTLGLGVAMASGAVWPTPTATPAPLPVPVSRPLATPPRNRIPRARPVRTQRAREGAPPGVRRSSSQPPHRFTALRGGRHQCRVVSRAGVRRFHGR